MSATASMRGLLAANFATAAASSANTTANWVVISRPSLEHNARSAAVDPMNAGGSQPAGTP
jgi:hypothetical protein